MKNNIYNLFCSPFTHNKKIPLNCLKYYIVGGKITAKEKHDGVIQGIVIKDRVELGEIMRDFEPEQLVLEKIKNKSPVYRIIKIKEEYSLVSLIGKISKKSLAPKGSSIDLILEKQNERACKYRNKS